MELWINGLLGGLMQGNKRVKHQFREGNLLRVADVRGKVWASARWFRCTSFSREGVREQLGPICLFRDPFCGPPFVHADHLKRVPFTHVPRFMLCDVEQHFTNQDEVICSPFGSFTP